MVQGSQSGSSSPVSAGRGRWGVPGPCSGTVTGSSVPPTEPARPARLWPQAHRNRRAAAGRWGSPAGLLRPAPVWASGGPGASPWAPAPVGVPSCCADWTLPGEARRAAAGRAEDVSAVTRWRCARSLRPRRQGVLVMVEPSFRVRVDGPPCPCPATPVGVPNPSRSASYDHDDQLRKVTSARPCITPSAPRMRAFGVPDREPGLRRLGCLSGRPSRTTPLPRRPTVCMPRIMPTQVKQRVGTRGSLRRGGRVGVCPGG